MKTASIETVAEVLPHPNADRLELAKVGIDWDDLHSRAPAAGETVQVRAYSVELDWPRCHTFAGAKSRSDRAT